MPSSSIRRVISVLRVRAMSLGGWPLRERSTRYAIAFATGFHFSVTGLVTAVGACCVSTGETSVGALLLPQFVQDDSN